MRLPEEPDLPFQINIVPMIDVIFAILTFFIMSSLFLTRSTGLPVNLPKAGTAQQQPATPLTVTVTAKGSIRLNQQAVPLRQLQQQVSRLVQGQSALVIVNADAAVSHGQVIQVMDQLRQIPGVKIAIAAEAVRSP